LSEPPPEKPADKKPTVVLPQKRLSGKAVLPTMSVERFLREFSSLEITLLAGKEGLSNQISSPRIQKEGLPLAGVLDYIHTERIQVLGSTEINYLATKSPWERHALLKPIFEKNVCCFLITKGLDPPPEVIQVADTTGTPLLKTPHVSSSAINEITDGLMSLLAPTISTHGVLLDVYGVGLLIIGHGSIGKSECALDLIVRGHRLVSDDMVEIRKRGESLLGTAPELLRYHMELRGVGIINIKDLFGVVATTQEKEVELVVELEGWREDQSYDRLGLDDQFIKILSVPVPYLLLPVAPGRNISILLEVAVRNLMLKRKGIHSAREFASRLESLLEA
jgi:HPr kinase/phosphorylase